MTRTAIAASLAAMLAAIVFFHAADAGAGDIAVSDAWARATPGAARNGAAYVTIANRGGTADRLVAARSPVAGRVEIHTHDMSGGVMRMRKLDGVAVAAGSAFRFEPGGHHLMLIGLAAPLREGQHFPLALRFEKSGWTEFTVRVLGVGAQGLGSDPGGAESAPMGGHRHGHGR